MRHLILACALLLVGCAGDSTSPTTPTPAPIAPTRVIGLSGPVAFGDVQLGSSKTATLIVSNRGTSPLTWTGISGGFADTTVTPPTSGTIAAGSSTTLVFAFAPKTLGQRSAPLTIAGDFTDGNNATTMTGNGIAAVVVVASATGTWRGTARSTKCTDDGAAVEYCRNLPVTSGPLTLVLSQFVGGQVAGSIEWVGYPVNTATGSLVGERLQINGSGRAGAFDYEYRNWNTTIAANTMAGTFSWLLSLKSGGFVRYDVTLDTVTRQ